VANRVPIQSGQSLASANGHSLKQKIDSESRFVQVDPHITNGLGSFGNPATTAAKALEPLLALTILARLLEFRAIATVGYHRENLYGALAFAYDSGVSRNRAKARF
jgi:hypothetical protein